MKNLGSQVKVINKTNMDQRQPRWIVKIYDDQDKRVATKKCHTLADIAQLFGRSRACDLSHLLNEKIDMNTRRNQMLKRWSVWFTVERAPNEMPLAIREAVFAQGDTEKKPQSSHHRLSRLPSGIL